MFWSAGASATVLLLVTALSRHDPLTGYSLTTWLNFLALGLVTQMPGQPALTVMLAIPLLGEIPTSLHVVGAVALIAGVYLVHRGWMH